MRCKGTEIKNFIEPKSSPKPKRKLPLQTRASWHEFYEQTTIKHIESTRLRKIKGSTYRKGHSFHEEQQNRDEHMFTNQNDQVPTWASKIRPVSAIK